MIITPNTSYAAVIGHPIGHSLSPQLHNSIYDKIGIDMIYLAFDIPSGNLESAVEGLCALNFSGFNVTIPHKEEVIAFLDKIDPMAAAIGAVNTVKIEGRRMTGYNTDGLGFLHSLKGQCVECKGRNILILGAGGSARAIGITLADQTPGEILILNRNRDRGERLAMDINEYAGYGLSRAVGDVPDRIDIIINTTPLGMWPKVLDSPLAGYTFNPETIVCDIVYNPLETALLGEAKRSGCKTVGGLGMLVGQGIKAVEIWTDKGIDDSTARLVYDGLYNTLKKRSQ
ncbi:MAG: shikimate dehydrogenase [Clostridiales bacterium]|nr:shikimate dehydrogenase [Clostridiales bacterium]